MHRLIDRFLDMMAAERGAAAHTQAVYRRDLEGAEGFAKARGCDLQQAGEADLQAYMTHLNQRGMAAATVARHLSSLRHFYKFRCWKNCAAIISAARLVRPKSQRPLPKHLSRQETEAFLIAAAYALPQSSEKEAADRMRAICLIEVLYAAGLRVSELVSLPRGALDGPLLIIRGKGGRDRLVPLSEKARQAIADWLAYCLPRAAFLFPARSKAGHLTRQRFTQILAPSGALRRVCRPGEGQPRMWCGTLLPPIWLKAWRRFARRAATCWATPMTVNHADCYTHVLEERKKPISWQGKCTHWQKFPLNRVNIKRAIV